MCMNANKITVINLSYKMVERYEQLFRQLYEKRLINIQAPINSYDRVRLLQKKIAENESGKKCKTNLSIKIRDSGPLLEDLNSQAPKRIIREKVANNNKSPFKRRPSLPSQRTSYQQFNRDGEQNMISAAMTMRNSNVYTYREKSSCPTGLYHSKKFQIIKRSAPMTAESTRRNSLSKRAATPSKNVIIGGCNLEQQAQIYQKQFKELELEIEKHNNQLKLKQSQEQRKLADKIKANRYEKQHVSNLRKQNLMIKHTKQMWTKLDKSRGRDREQLNGNNNNELMPWTVLVPEYEYY